jgi:DNA-binding beta-propeller fold protein YncE
VTRLRAASLSAALIAVAVAGSTVATAVPRPPVTVVSTDAVPGGSFYAVAVDPVRHLAYVASGAAPDGHTEVVDTRTGATTDLALPSNNASMAINEKTGLVYIPDTASGTVAVLRGASVVTTITLPVGSQPGDATIDPVTGRVYVDEFKATAVAVIKGTAVVTTITVGKSPAGGAVDPSTGDVYIPNAGDDTVSVIRGTAVVKTVKVGSAPDFVAVDPSSRLAYVANIDGDTVSILHGTKLLHTTKVGDDPDTIVVDPRTQLAYVENLGSSSVSILHGLTVKATIKLVTEPNPQALDVSDGLVIVPTNLTHVVVLSGTKKVQTLNTPKVQSWFAGVDTRNGRVVLSSYAGVITVLQLPTPGKVTITRPTHRHYTVGAKVHVRFRCSHGTNNTVTSCKGSTANRHRLPTGTEGVHHFVVKLTQAYGPTIRKTITYRVVKSG